MDDFHEFFAADRSTLVPTAMMTSLVVQQFENTSKNQVKKILASLMITLLLILPFYVYPRFPVNEVAFKILIRVLLLSTLSIMAMRGGLRNDFNLGSHITWLWLFVTMAVLSILYSSDRQFSAMRALDLLGFVLLASILSARFCNFDASINFVESVLYLYLIGFLFIALGFNESLMRSMGEDAISRLGGFIINPNLFAYCCLFLLYISMYRIHERGKLLTVLVAFSLLWLIYLTYSRSVILIIAVSFFLIKRPHRNLQLFRYFSFSLAFFGFFVSYDRVINFLERGHGIENLLSLGGRTLFWSGLVTDAQFGVNILYGFGYQMMSDRGGVFQTNELKVAMAHNNLIQSLVGLGCIGLLINIFFWFALYAFVIKSRHCIENRKYNLMLALCHATLVYSMVEYGIFGPSTIIAPLFFIFIFSYSRHVAALRMLEHHRSGAFC